MSDTAQYVADRIALADVMTNYARAVDDRDMNLYRAQFADDCEIVGFGKDIVRGGDAWRSYVETALARFGPTQHMLGPQHAVVTGDTAKCRTDVQAHHYMKDDPKTTLTLWATYFTDMRRIGGTWKIQRHELVSRGTRIQTDA